MIYGRGPKYWMVVVTLALLMARVPSLSAQDDLAVKASQLMQAGKFHDAEALWRQLAVTHPRSAEVYGNLGVCLSQQGKLQQAAAEYFFRENWTGRRSAHDRGCLNASGDRVT